MFQECQQKPLLLFGQAATDTIFLIPNATDADASAGGTLAVIAPRLKTLISIRGAAEDPAGGSDGAAKNITLRGLSFAHSAPSCEPPQARPRPLDLKTAAGEVCWLVLRF